MSFDAIATGMHLLLSEALARASPARRRKKAHSAGLPFAIPAHMVHYLTKLTWTDVDDRANHFPRGTSYFPGIGPALGRSRDRAVSCPVGEGRHCATRTVAQGRSRRAALLYRARGVWRHGPRLPLRRGRVRGTMALRRERAWLSDPHRSGGDLPSLLWNRSAKAPMVAQDGVGRSDRLARHDGTPCGQRPQGDPNPRRSRRR